MPQDRTRATEDRPTADETRASDPQQATRTDRGRQAPQILGAGVRDSMDRRQYLLGMPPSLDPGGMQSYETLYDNVNAEL